jgi:hypothetical protein
MVKKKTTTSSKTSNGTSRKSANGKQTNKTAISKLSRNGPDLTANELMLRAWEKIYANRHRFVKV